MNKTQKKCIAECLSATLRKIERCENLLDKAQNNGDSVQIESLLMRIKHLAAELKGADTVLTMVGYVRVYHDDENGGYYTIEKI